MKVRSYFKVVLFFVSTYQVTSDVSLLLGQSVPPVQAPLVTPVPSYPQASVQSLNPQAADQTKSVSQPIAFSGPDTSTYPEEVIGSYGNWMKKKQWWKDARTLSREIGGISREIAELRKTFIQKYIGIKDQKMNFYQEVELGSGKLDWLFASLDKYLEKKRRKEIEAIHEKNQHTEMRKREIQDSIDAIEETIRLYKTQLEQLKFDMQSIDDLDKSLLDRLTKIGEHIKKVNEDATNVNEIIKTMLHVIDHNKARELYYKLKNEIIGKLQAIKTYLSQTLTQDFDTVSTTLTSQIEKTKATIKTLEQNGLIIKDRARKIAVIKEEKIRQKEMKKSAEQDNSANQKKRVKKEVQPSGWFSPIINLFSTLYDVVVGLVASIIVPIKELIYPAPPKKRMPRVVEEQEKKELVRVVSKN